jgi:ABC-type multidrug transport system permease subunit
MLGILLAKDLRRVWRNPLPAVINVALPLCITALIGLAFGGKSGNELERIHFAVVDEDQSFLSNLLRGAMNQNQSSNHLDPVFVDRETALRQINQNQVSGALIIPIHFTHDYFKGNDTTLELIKNPAQSIQPAALEELAGIVVTAMNGVSRNFKAQFPDWRGAFEGEVDHHRLAKVIEVVGDRLETMKKYLKPPLVSYEKETSGGGQMLPAGPASPSAPQAVNTNAPDARGATGSATAAEQAVPGKRVASDQVASNGPAPSAGAAPAVAGNAAATRPAPRPISLLSKVFAWVLVGLSAMFLLFLANNAMAGLYHELRVRTFERYQTLRQQLLPFVVSKVVFAVVFLLLASAVMLGGGGLIFHVQWRQPLALVTLVFSYACCSTGIMALLAALMPDERRAETINTLVGMLMGFAGGCTFPTRNLPRFLRDHVTPLMPTDWFVNAAHQLQAGDAVAWGFVSLKLLVLSALLIAMAVFTFQYRFKRGLRP